MTRTLLHSLSPLLSPQFKLPSLRIWTAVCSPKRPLSNLPPPTMLVHPPLGRAEGSFLKCVMSLFYSQLPASHRQTWSCLVWRLSNSLAPPRSCVSARLAFSLFLQHTSPIPMLGLVCTLPPLLDSLSHLLIFASLKILIYLFVCLFALGLSCGTWAP